MKIIVQGLATEYQDNGIGKIILFLHGWKDDLHTFDLIAQILSLTNRVVRLDLPGFGVSETPKKPWGLDNYVQFVKDFIQKSGIQVEMIVGHSFGGRIIIKGEATKNFKASKIVLINSAGLAKRNTVRNKTLKILAKFVGLIMYIPPLFFWRERLRKKAYKFIGSDYLDTGILKKIFLKIIAEDLSESAKKITKPTLLIWGENDIETPLSDGKRLSQLIRDSKLKVISGAGHFVHKKKPQEVVKLIQEFL